MILLEFLQEIFGGATIFVICIGGLLYAVIVNKLFEGWEVFLDVNNRFISALYCILAIMVSSPFLWLLWIVVISLFRSGGVYCPQGRYGECY